MTTDKEHLGIRKHLSRLVKNDIDGPECPGQYLAVAGMYDQPKEPFQLVDATATERCLNYSQEAATVALNKAGVNRAGTNQSETCPAGLTQEIVHGFSHEEEENDSDKEGHSLTFLMEQETSDNQGICYKNTLPFFLCNPSYKEMCCRLEGVPQHVVETVFLPKLSDLAQLAKQYELQFAPKRAGLATKGRIVSVNLETNKRRRTHGNNKYGT